MTNRYIGEDNPTPLEQFLSSYDEQEQMLLIEGIDARLMGKAITDNPYVEGQGDWMFWNEGWDFADRLEASL